MFTNDTCMSDSDFMQEGDGCQLNPKNCSSGISFSVWEKIIYSDDIMIKHFDRSHVPEKRFLISTGASYNSIEGTAFPGVAVYHEGVSLVAVVSTGDEVWEINVIGQLLNDTWANIGVRWNKPDLLNTKGKSPEQLGGLELYVNLQKVGHVVLPEFTDSGSSVYTEKTNYKISGQEPPVMTLGCEWNHETESFTHFSGAEYDELAMWSRKLSTNNTHNEIVFFLGGFEDKYENVNPAQFQAMLNGADLGDDVEASIAKDVLEAMLLPPAPEAPAIPTPTTSKADPKKTTAKIETTTTKQEDTTEESGPDSDLITLANKQKQLQDIMRNMLNVEQLRGVRSPENVEARFPVSIVAGKIIAGSDKDNLERWDAFNKVYKELEGAPETLKDLNQYILTWVGATNTSAETTTNFFNPDTDSMRYTTSGEDFVLYAEKLPVPVFREEPRLNYPNYDGLEWFANQEKWDSPFDTISVPTGMFKDQSGCNDNPVSFVVSLFNEIGQIMPRRRNLAYIFSGDWRVDSKIVYTSVAANVDPLDYDDELWEEVALCTPDPEYMKYNPVRVKFYHKEPESARLKRRKLQTWFTDSNRGGVEVRQCVWWNENLFRTGGWDPSVCDLIETDEFKTTCECKAFGAMAVVAEQYEKVEIEDDCEPAVIVKYVFMGISIALLIFYCAIVTLSKYVGDMFHLLRVHIAVTWIGALIMHIVSDFDSIRDDQESNMAVGFVMMYFYTASFMWIACESHATFRAFTGGIISGRSKVYIPFGYGTPMVPLGILLLVYHDDLGVDPRCFVAWNRDAKVLYLVWNMCIAFVAVVFAIIILFNLARPQTKRKNVISDLKSQAYGTVVLGFLTFILWIVATATYLHRQDSDFEDPYCGFIIFLGLFGIIMFCCIGVASKKFRYVLARKNKKKSEEFDDVATAAEVPDDDDGASVSVADARSVKSATTTLAHEDEKDHSSSSSSASSSDNEDAPGDDRDKESDQI